MSAARERVEQLALIPAPLLNAPVEAQSGTPRFARGRGYGTYREGMTQQQQYSVVRTYPGFELRCYAPHVLAEMTVTGDFDSAGSAAFGPLVSYIGGRNETGAKFAMTAPVIQQQQSARQHDVAFVLPADADVANVPTPADARVRTRAVDQEWAAAARFSGRWTESSFEEHANKLLAAMAAAGVEPIGAPRFMRYNPPTTPWFMRRNEVIVPIAEPVMDAEPAT